MKYAENNLKGFVLVTTIVVGGEQRIAQTSMWNAFSFTKINILNSKKQDILTHISAPIYPLGKGLV